MVLTWVVGLPSAGRTRGLVLAVDAAAGLSHIQRFHSLSLLAVGYAGVLDPGCSRLAAAAVALLLPSSTKRHTTDPVILELDVEHAELAQSHAFRIGVSWGGRAEPFPLLTRSRTRSSRIKGWRW